jgi:hypothetical protein
MGTISYYLQVHILMAIEVAIASHHQFIVGFDLPTVN